MPDFKTKDDVLKAYDDALEKLAVINDNYQKTMSIIQKCFLTGVKYVDKNGVEQISKGVDPNDPNWADETKACVAVYGKGQTLIGECTRPGSATNLMMWYAKSQGITSEELIELGKNPESAKSKKTLDKLDYIKQGFADTINSADPEKVANLYMGMFKAFKKDSDLMLNSGNLDSFVNNWPHLVQWAGCTGTIQQSFDHSGVPNEGQMRLQNLLTDKIKKSFGEDMELRDLLSCMYAVNQATQDFEKTAKDLDTIRKYKKLGSTVRNEYRVKFVDTIRNFNVIQSLGWKKAMFGEPVNYVSKDLSKAAVIAGFGLFETDVDWDDDYEAERDYNDTMGLDSIMVINEMRGLAGDDSILPLYKISNATDFRYDNEEKGQLYNVPSTEGRTNFCDIKNYKELLSKNEKIDAIVARKRAANEELTHEEVVVFLSEENPSFSKSMKESVSSFINMDPSFRMNKLSPDMQYVLKSYCQKQFGITPEEYISGIHSVTGLCKAAYDAQIKKINSQKTTEVINKAYQKNITDLLAMRLADVGVTAASSDEFKEMDKAFNEVKKPIENPDVYKARLRQLLDKSSKYIAAKKADGKTERSTGKGQKRYTLAQRMEAFARESLAQIEKAEDAVLMQKIPDNMHKTGYAEDLFYSRVEGLLAPKTKGCPELLQKGLYSDKPEGLNYFVPTEMKLAENNPFTDRQVAMIAYAALANPQNFLDGIRYDKNVSPEVNLQNAITHSHDDIFSEPRLNTANDVPLFNNARKDAEDCINKYVNGDAEPLAKLLKNNIDVTLKHVRSLEKVSDVMNGHILGARASLEILSSDPKLMKLSGITAKEVKEIIAKEAQLKINDDALKAEQKLAENPDMPREEKANCVASIIAAKVIFRAEKDSIDDSFNLPQAKQDSKDFDTYTTTLGDLNYQKDKIEKGEIEVSPAEEEQLDNSIAETQVLKDTAFAKLGLASIYREPSKLLQNFNNQAGFEMTQKALLTIIKKNPEFNALVDNPAKIDAKLNDFKRSAERNLAPLVNKMTLAKSNAPQPEVQPARENNGPEIVI